MEKANSMLEYKSLDKKLWGVAVQTAAYLVNRSPAAAIGKTPYELWNKQKPNVANLKVFGSDAFVHIPKQFRGKFDAKSWKGIFVGYSANGYRIWNPQKNCIGCSRDVIFVENSSGRYPDESEVVIPKEVDPVVV